MNRVQELLKLGQSVWLDYIRRDMMTGGKLKELIDTGVRGMTSNPSIFEKALASCPDYDDAIGRLLTADRRTDVNKLYEALAIEDIRMAADAFRPQYEESDHVDGMISLEASPFLAADTDGSIAEARRLWKLVDRPNLMIKIPATPEGIAAVETLIAEGLNVNITLMFSRKHYEAVGEAYLKGIARCRQPGRVTSVASFFVSRVDTLVDKQLEKIGTAEALGLRGKAAVANCKMVYRRFREVFAGQDYFVEQKRGARLQRLLWGSTSTKNPAYSDVLYVDNLIGPDTVNTMPLETVEAFLDHGKVRRTVDEGIGEATAVLDSLARLGIDLDAVTEQLQKDGVRAFADSFTKLLHTLDSKAHT